MNSIFLIPIISIIALGWFIPSLAEDYYEKIKSDHNFPFETQDYGSIGSTRLQVSENCFMRDLNNLICVRGKIVDISRIDASNMWSDYYD